MVRRAVPVGIGRRPAQRGEGARPPEQSISIRSEQESRCRMTANVAGEKSRERLRHRHSEVANASREQGRDSTCHLSVGVVI